MNCTQQKIAKLWYRSRLLFGKLIFCWDIISGEKKLGWIKAILENLLLTSKAKITNHKRKQKHKHIGNRKGKKQCKCTKLFE